MVSGDHYSLHACRLEIRHGPGSLRPGRVPHAHHPQEGQILLFYPGASCSVRGSGSGKCHISFLCRFHSHRGSGILRLHGNRQCAQCFPGHLLQGGLQLPSVVIIQPYRAVLRKNHAAALQHFVRRAFCIGYQPCRRQLGRPQLCPGPAIPTRPSVPSALLRTAVPPVQRSHHLPVGIKGKFVHSGHHPFQLWLSDSMLLRQIQQRQLCRIAASTALFYGSIVAQNHPLQELGADGRNTLLRFPHSAAHPAFFHRHAVLGQRAGLVGADHADSAQRLHGGQPAHDGIHLHHPGNAQSQADGHHRRKAFGNRRHCQGYGRDQHLRHVSMLQHRYGKQGSA